MAKRRNVACDAHPTSNERLTCMGEVATPVELEFMDLVRAGDMKMVLEALNDDGAPPRLNAVDENGKTALHAAVQARRHEMVTLLLSRGINPLIQGKYDGNTVLHDAAIIGDSKVSLQLVKFCPTILRVTHCWGRTAAEEAGRHNMMSTCRMLMRETAKQDARTFHPYFLLPTYESHFSHMAVASRRCD